MAAKLRFFEAAASDCSSKILLVPLSFLPSYPMRCGFAARTATHRFPLPLLGTLLVLTLACGQKGRRIESRGLAGAAHGWNVVLISIDTLRADRLNSYGYEDRETSPMIDDLVGSGVRFANAQAPRALTWPSLATVLSGLYPSGHGLISNGYRFDDDQPTLPILLQAAGYQTGAFLSNMCQANHRGWSELFCAGGVDKRLNRQATAWLDSLDSGRPFLLWAHYFGPHPPYYNGGELAAKRLDPGYDGALKPKKGVLDRIMTQGIELDDADLTHLAAIYDAAVIGTDGYVSELLAALSERADLGRTVVVLLADHGEDLYQHNRYLYHACSVYQSSLHVPLAFSAPGLIPRDALVTQTVELTDVLPTILDLLGLDAPDCLHGTSLVRYLQRPDRQGIGKPAFTEYGETQIRTVLEERWKLISNPDGLTPMCFPNGPPELYLIDELELYDLRSDPEERINLAATETERVSALLERIKSRKGTLCGRSPGESQEIPPKLEKELESLGYVAN